MGDCVIGTIVSPSLELVFSDDYFTARDKFRFSCVAHGFELEFFECPAKGPEDQSLSVDIGYRGPADPQNLFVTVSGVHGVEGMAGSACQLDFLLNDYAGTFPSDCGVLFVHFLNPFGAAWRCTETHENIDLNRNFLDFSAPLPQNAAYDEVRDIFACRQFRGADREEADHKLARYIEENGLDRFLSASAAGQYHDPKGLAFGGQSEAWANTLLQSRLKKFRQSVKHAVIVDIHTGLGPYGAGTILANLPRNAPGGDDVYETFGEFAVFNANREIGYSVTAGLDKGCRNALPGVSMLAVALEFGTCDIMDAIEATRDRIWLSNWGDYHSALGQKISSALLETYFRPETEWRELVLLRWRQVVRQCAAALQRAS